MIHNFFTEGDSKADALQTFAKSLSGISEALEAVFPSIYAWIDISSLALCETGAQLA